MHFEKKFIIQSIESSQTNCYQKSRDKNVGENADCKNYYSTRMLNGIALGQANMITITDGTTRESIKEYFGASQLG